MAKKYKIVESPNYRGIYQLHKKDFLSWYYINSYASKEEAVEALQSFIKRNTTLPPKVVIYFNKYGEEINEL